MLIASRTPEGEPNFCPVCAHEVCIEPSYPPGDAPCPCCGHLLWFVEPTSYSDWKRFTTRDAQGRYLDRQGNVLDAETGHVNFVATFAAAIRDAEGPLDCPYHVAEEHFMLRRVIQKIERQIGIEQ